MINYHFIQGDICDFDLVSNVIREFAIDTVVHFAAESHVDRSILSPGQFINTNIIGTYNLLENCRLIWKDFGGFRRQKISPCFNRRSFWDVKNWRSCLYRKYTLRS